MNVCWEKKERVLEGTGWREEREVMGREIASVGRRKWKYYFGGKGRSSARRKIGGRLPLQSLL